MSNNNNIYKYYHLRASPDPAANSASKPLYQQPHSTSPWRGTTTLPLNRPAPLVLHQIIPSPVTTTVFTPSERSLQQQALEKQNEILKREKLELENQIQRLKTQYTKQSSFDQQELMRVEREKASLSDSLRERDHLVSSLKGGKYEVNGNEYSSRKSEPDTKVGGTQEEVAQLKNKLRIQEINQSDLIAKMQILEQINKDLRTKWDDDIKNYGIELENHKRQLLKERYRNEELERSLKAYKLGQQSGANGSDQKKDEGQQNGNSHSNELQVARKEIVELSARNQELERKLTALLENNKEPRQSDQYWSSNSSTSNSNAGSVLREKLEQKIIENDRLRADLLKRTSEIDILKKEIAQVLQRHANFDKNQAEKDLLVQQMLEHIDRIERENEDLKTQLRKLLSSPGQFEHKLNQVSLTGQQQQQKLDQIAAELLQVTKRNRLLEEQLRAPGKLRHIQSAVESIEFRLTMLSEQIVKLNARTIRHTSSVMIGAEKQVADITNDLQKIKKDLKAEVLVEQAAAAAPTPTPALQQMPGIAMEVDDDQYNGRERQNTGEFSPVRERHDEIISNGEKFPSKEKDETQVKSSQSISSEFKIVTIPQPLIKLNQIVNNNNNGHDANAYTSTGSHPTSIHHLNPSENSSQQTFGEIQKDSIEAKQQQEELEYLIQQTKAEQQKKQDHELHELLNGTGGSVSSSIVSSDARVDPNAPPAVPLQTLHPLRFDADLIELDIVQILNSESSTYEFAKSLEGKEVFDLVIGFIGGHGSWKTTVMNSIIKEEWDNSNNNNTTSCNNKLQIKRYKCMAKQVAMVECDLISEMPFMHFVCNFAQALVLFFKSWQTPDQRTFSEYVKLLQSEVNFASELIIIHSDSHLLDAKATAAITQDLTQLQEGLYRGKLDGKLKKINVYHVMLHDHSDKKRSQSIFEEVIAVCRGTIIGKLSSSKEKIDLFKKLNKFLKA